MCRYLENCRKYVQSYYLWLIGSCMCAFDWHKDRWPWMTLNSISLNSQRISQDFAEILRNSLKIQTYRVQGHRSLCQSKAQISDATTAKRMKINQYCQRQRYNCKHVELEQFWHAFASRGFVSDTQTARLSCCNWVENWCKRRQLSSRRSGRISKTVKEASEIEDGTQTMAHSESDVWMNARLGRVRCLPFCHRSVGFLRTSVTENLIATWINSVTGRNSVTIIVGLGLISHSLNRLYRGSIACVRPSRASLRFYRKVGKP